MDLSSPVHLAFLRRSGLVLLGVHHWMLRTFVNGHSGGTAKTTFTFRALDARAGRTGRRSVNISGADWGRHLISLVRTKLN